MWHFNSIWLCHLVVPIDLPVVITPYDQKLKKTLARLAAAELPGDPESATD
jgi:hypothetical protein